jgi:hypothetical protein
VKNPVRESEAFRLFHVTLGYFSNVVFASRKVTENIFVTFSERIATLTVKIRVNGQTEKEETS